MLGIGLPPLAVGWFAGGIVDRFSDNIPVDEVGACF